MNMNLKVREKLLNMFIVKQRIPLTSNIIYLTDNTHPFFALWGNVVNPPGKREPAATATLSQGSQTRYNICRTLWPN